METQVEYLSGCKPIFSIVPALMNNQLFRTYSHGTTDVKGENNTVFKALSYQINALHMGRT